MSDIELRASSGTVVSVAAFGAVLALAVALMAWTLAASLRRQTELLERSAACESAREVDALQGLRAAFELHAQPRRVLGP